MQARRLILLVISALLAGAAQAQGSASAVASCTIVTPLQVQNEGPLAFGALSVGSTSGGAVSVEPWGERSSQGAVVLQAGDWGAARFRVRGEDGAGFVVTLPERCFLKRTEGPEELLVSDFACFPGDNGNLTGGVQSISVGATLHVGAGQAEGTYVGTFEVAVAYE